MRSTPSTTSAEPTISFSDFDITDYRQVFVDLDGTLLVDDQAIPGAAEFLHSVRDRGQALWVLTNNSSDSKAGHAARLSSRGIDVAPDEIVLSARSSSLDSTPS